RLRLEPLLLALQQRGLGLVARGHRTAVGASELTGAAQQCQVAPDGGRGYLEVLGQVVHAGQPRLSGARHDLLATTSRLAGQLSLPSMRALASCLLLRFFHKIARSVLV